MTTTQTTTDPPVMSEHPEGNPTQGLPLDDARFKVDTTPLMQTPETSTPAEPIYGGTAVAPAPAPPTPREPPTREEWLAEAKEAQTVLARNDHVSPELIERLFLDAIPVIEGYTPPTPSSARKSKSSE